MNAILFKSFFDANIKIAAVIIIPEISQHHPASDDYASVLRIILRKGSVNVNSVNHVCSGSTTDPPLISPEFDCDSTLGYGLSIKR
jgi:hypothetical protein